jgi:hypothetical protein
MSFVTSVHHFTGGRPLWLVSTSTRNVVETQAVGALAGARITRAGGGNGFVVLDPFWSAFFIRANEVVIVSSFENDGDAVEAQRAADSVRSALIELCGQRLTDLTLVNVGRRSAEVQLALRKCTSGWGQLLVAAGKVDLAAQFLSPEQPGEERVVKEIRAANDITAVPADAVAEATAFRRSDALSESIQGLKLPGSVIGGLVGAPPPSALALGRRLKPGQCGALIGLLPYVPVTAVKRGGAETSPALRSIGPRDVERRLEGVKRNGADDADDGDGRGDGSSSDSGAESGSEDVSAGLPTLASSSSSRLADPAIADLGNVKVSVRTACEETASIAVFASTASDDSANITASESSAASQPSPALIASTGTETSSSLHISQAESAGTAEAAGTDVSVSSTLTETTASASDATPSTVAMGLHLETSCAGQESSQQEPALILAPQEAGQTTELPEPLPGSPPAASRTLRLSTSHAVEVLQESLKPSLPLTSAQSVSSASGAVTILSGGDRSHNSSVRLELTQSENLTIFLQSASGSADGCSIDGTLSLAVLSGDWSLQTLPSPVDGSIACALTISSWAPLAKLEAVFPGSSTSVRIALPDKQGPVPHAGLLMPAAPPGVQLSCHSTLRFSLAPLNRIGVASTPVDEGRHAVAASRTLIVRYAVVPAFAVAPMIKISPTYKLAFASRDGDSSGTPLQQHKFTDVMCRVQLHPSLAGRVSSGQLLLQLPSPPAPQHMDETPVYQTPQWKPLGQLNAMKNQILWQVMDGASSTGPDDNMPHAASFLSPGRAAEFKCRVSVAHGSIAADTAALGAGTWHPTTMKASVLLKGIVANPMSATLSFSTGDGIDAETTGAAVSRAQSASLPVHIEARSPQTKLQVIVK